MNTTEVARLYVANVRATRLAMDIRHFFPGFTLIEASGYWERLSEPTVIIEIINLNEDDNFCEKIENMAWAIAQTHNEDCVLVSITQTLAKLVYAKEKTS